MFRNPLVVLIVLLWFVAPAIIVGYLATRRGRSFGPWCVFGFLLWPVALIALFASTDLSHPMEVRVVDAAGSGLRASQVPTTAPDTLEQIRKLAELRDTGALSNDEFEAKKAELLSRV